jgi:predicted DNA-binding transcriptional regulator AlpA
MPNFHLDKRADLIAAAGVGDSDDLLTTKDMARWLRVSTQWLHRARAAGYGPPYERIGPHCIRYRRSKVLSWLDARSRRSTAEYARKAGVAEECPCPSCRSQDVAVEATA